MSSASSLSRPNLSDLASQFGAWVLRSRGAQAVLLANLAPLAGSIWFGWDAFTVVFVYWLENLVIGAFNVLKMILAHGDAPSYLEFYRRQPLMLVTLPILVGFFIFHYFGFCYGHGVFVFAVFDKSTSMYDDLPAWVQSELTLGVVLSLAALVAEHAYWFYRNFWRRGDYKRYHPIVYMMLPYGRVAMVHCVLLFGALLVDFLSLPTAIVGLLLISLKLGPELVVVCISEQMREPAGPVTDETLAQCERASREKLDAFIAQPTPRYIPWFVRRHVLGMSRFVYLWGAGCFGLGTGLVVGLAKDEGMSPLLMLISLLPLLGLVVIVFTFRNRRLKKRLLREGLCCDARLTDVDETNVRINEQAQYKATFEFKYRGLTHQATSSVYGPAGKQALAIAEAGSTTRILVDPRDVERVLWIDALLAT